MIRSLAMGALLMAALYGQTPESPEFRGGVVNVQVPVTVMTGGRPIHTLMAEDFQLFDNGVAQTFALDILTHPVSLVVAVQANSTTKNVLPQVRATSALLAPLVAGSTGEVALLSFDHRVQSLLPFTSNPEEISAGFEKLQAGSGPHHLDDAAMEALRLLNTRGKDRKKILLLISQDRDEGSSLTTRQVFEQAELDGILVYAVSMKTALAAPSMKRKNPVPPEGRAPLPMGTLQTQTTDVQNGGYAPTLAEMYEIVRRMKAHNTLEAYTELTGGSQQKFTNQKTLDAAIQQIGREIHSQYVLTFAPSAPAPGFHSISVQVRRRGLQVRARRAYRLSGETR